MSKILKNILQKIPYDVLSDAELRNVLGGTAYHRYGVVKRAIARGDMVSIRKGLYALALPYRRNEINLFSLAQHIYGPSYVSLESALSYHGWIPEAVYTVTSVCTKQSKNFDTPLGFFTFTHVPEKIFYAGTDRVESSSRDVFLMARPFKALMDYVYVYKKDWTCLEPIVESLRIEADMLKTVTREEMEAIEENYSSRRILRCIKGIKKELGYEH